MIKIIKKTKGETILETIIAFTILALGVTFAGMIMSTSIRNMNNSKNRIIAVNIAREGIEAVRNIRDTNWLRFHSKKRACWNKKPILNPDIPCDGSINSLIEPGIYTVYKQGGYKDKSIYTLGQPVQNPPTYRWMLGDLKWNGIPTASTAPSVTNGDYYHNTTEGFTYFGVGGKWINIAQLDSVDIDPFQDTDSDGIYNNDINFYNHIYVHPESNNNPLGTFVKETPFIRIITIKYLDNNGTEVTSNIGLKPNVNRMQVKSRVIWKNGGVQFDVELVTHLTDYLGRERLAG